MLRILTSFYGYAIRAMNGEIGCVHEFLFDEKTWGIRSIVVKTGSWLTGRRVLVPVGAAGRPDLSTMTLPVRMTTKQIEDCPAFLTDSSAFARPPVDSRATYQWIGPVPSGHLPGTVDGAGEDYPREGAMDGRSVRSTRDVVGCHIQAGEEKIGHLEDFILDDEHWRIRYLVIGTRHSRTGKHILISPGWITAVSWDKSKVQIDLKKESVWHSPEYDPAVPVDREFEVRLYDYYFGRPFDNDISHTRRMAGIDASQ